MKVKFERVSAAVKGHLTRRLLNTEKVQIVVQTIRDTVELLLKLYEEAPAITESMPSVRPQDSGLHQRLVQQASITRSIQCLQCIAATATTFITPKA